MNYLYPILYIALVVLIVLGIILIVWSYTVDSYQPLNSDINKELKLNQLPNSIKILDARDYRKLVKVLEKFDKLCRDRNAVYFLVEESLLSARRYQNLAPWDQEIKVYTNLPVGSNLSEYGLIREGDAIFDFEDLERNYPIRVRSQHDFCQEDLEPLRRAKFGPIEVMLPNHPNRYLKKLYPGYKNKISYYHEGREVVYIKDRHNLNLVRNFKGV